MSEQTGASFGPDSCADAPSPQAVSASGFDPSRELLQVFANELRKAMQKRRSAEPGSRQAPEAWDNIASIMCTGMGSDGPLFGDFVLSLVERTALGTDAR